MGILGGPIFTWVVLRAAIKLIAKSNGKGTPHSKFSNIKTPKVLITGRTGVGKSSLINCLASASNSPQRVETGDVASTSQDLEPVLIEIEGKSVCLVDTPGIGEVSKHEEYSKSVLEWYLYYKDSTILMVHVLQADQKGYFDDAQLIAALQKSGSTPIILVVNQIDKMKPVREPLESGAAKTWLGGDSLKSINIRHKLDHISSQFNIPRELVIPLAIVSEDDPFNIEGVLDEIGKYLNTCHTSSPSM